MVEVFEAKRKKKQALLNGHDVNKQVVGWNIAEVN